MFMHLWMRFGEVRFAEGLRSLLGIIHAIPTGELSCVWAGLAVACQRGRSVEQSSLSAGNKGIHCL